jgi:predicted transcriptional regulator of viral defense system
VQFFARGRRVPLQIEPFGQSCEGAPTRCLEQSKLLLLGHGMSGFGISPANCAWNTEICLQSSVSVSKKPHQRSPAEGQLLNLARNLPVLRARDVARQGIHTSTLTRMTRSGALEKVGPGRYRVPKRTRATEQDDLVAATGAIPSSVVCLVSALRFHNVGTQLPAEVWIAVPRGTRVPRLSAPPIRVVNVSTAVFDLGIEEHRLEGQAVRIYSLARTVADCFRFRNKVGLDVALEALRDAWRSKRLKLDELNRIAKKLRVHRVMQPYLETVVM